MRQTEIVKREKNFVHSLCFVNNEIALTGSCADSPGPKRGLQIKENFLLMCENHTGRKVNVMNYQENNVNSSYLLPATAKV